MAESISVIKKLSLVIIDNHKWEDKMIRINTMVWIKVTLLKSLKCLIWETGRITDPPLTGVADIRC